MDTEATFSELSTAHAVALRLRDHGARDEQIAVALGIPLEGVPTLLQVADAKLAALRREQSSDG